MLQARRPTRANLLAIVIWHSASASHRRRAAAIIVNDAVWRNIAEDEEQINAAVP
jgi:hypothetical protein